MKRVYFITIVLFVLVVIRPLHATEVPQDFPVNFLSSCAWGADYEIEGDSVYRMRLMIVDENGFNGIAAAALYNNRPEVIDLLLDGGFSANYRVKDGTSVLMLAAMRNTPAIVKRLLDAGADTTVKNDAGETAIDLALKNENFAEGAEDVLERLRGKNTVLTPEERRAARIKQAEQEKQARIASGAKLTDSEFIELCKSGSVQDIEKSIKGGSDVNAKTYLRDASTGKRKGISEFALMAAVLHNKSEVVEALIKAGVYLETMNYSGYTALMAAVERNDVRKVKLLIDAGADVNAHDSEHITVLTVAVKESAPEVVKMLIDAGANVNAKSKLGYTALCWTLAGCKYLESLNVLLDAGADLEPLNQMLSNYQGVTLKELKNIDLDREKGSPEVIEVLKIIQKRIK